MYFYRHDVAEVAGLTSFSFGEDEESRYVMLFKKVLGLCSYQIVGFSKQILSV